MFVLSCCYSRKMATDERNFRSSYYDKVGFRSVEEKRSLEILLKEKPLDRIKLKQFCLRFMVPGGHRNALWKLLLGISPCFSDNTEFVSIQRKQVYENLLHALQVMRILNADTSKPQLYVIMWLLESGKLKFDLQLQLDDQMFHGFLTLSESLSQIFEDDVDTYWVSKGFYNMIRTYYEHIPKLIEATRNILEKEDNTLYVHLFSINAFNVVRVERWFTCLFAGTLHKIALVKIWDKVIGGSYKILIFVAVVIFTTLRRNILGIETSEALLSELKSIPEQTCEVIGNKAIELWQQYGSPLVIGDARKEKE